MMVNVVTKQDDRALLDITYLYVIPNKSTLAQRFSHCFKFSFIKTIRYSLFRTHRKPAQMALNTHQ